MNDCLLCKIAKKEIAREIVFENDSVIVFNYTNPQAPVHLLLFPKKHIRSIMEVEELSSEEIAELLKAILKVAKIFGLDKSGFRVVTNCGTSAGQVTMHFHFHILGKRNFSWPPG